MELVLVNGVEFHAELTRGHDQRIENVKCIARGATKITLSYDKLFKTNSNGPVDPENAKAKKRAVSIGGTSRNFGVGQIDGTGKDTLLLPRWIHITKV